MSAAFDHLRRLLAKTSGLTLEADQLYFAQTRLAALARQEGVVDLDRLVARLEARPDCTLERAIVEAMSTHETYFFRDRAVFETFRVFTLPRLMAARAQEKRLRIWCAACSTGQEPFTLAMMLDEHARSLDGWRIEILATDFSREMIASAQAGLFSAFEVQRGLPISYLLRYFEQVDERTWRIRDRIQRRVRFMEHNLLDDMAALGRFDLIFCRNVLIYFDVATKRSVLARLAPTLAADGALVLGSAETVIGLCPEFEAHTAPTGFFIKRKRD